MRVQEYSLVVLGIASASGVAVALPVKRTAAADAAEDKFHLGPDYPYFATLKEVASVKRDAAEDKFHLGPDYPYFATLKEVASVKRDAAEDKFHLGPDYPYFATLKEVASEKRDAEAEAVADKYKFYPADSE